MLATSLQKSGIDTLGTSRISARRTNPPGQQAAAVSTMPVENRRQLPGPSQGNFRLRMYFITEISVRTTRAQPDDLNAGQHLKPVEQTACALSIIGVIGRALLMPCWQRKVCNDHPATRAGNPVDQPFQHDKLLVGQSAAPPHVIVPEREITAPV